MSDKHENPTQSEDAQTGEPGNEGPDPDQNLGELSEDVKCAADADVTVLITGRRRLTTQVARWIHQNGPRRKGPLVVVDCTRSTCPPGIVPGLRLAGEAAATDSNGAPQGAVLLLEEVSAMAPDALADLLRKVEASRLAPRRGAGPPGVRIIATTSTDLATGVAEGTFPEECFYCLNAIHLIVANRESADEHAPAAGTATRQRWTPD